MSCMWGRGITTGPWGFHCREEGVGISSREASSISASSGVLTWDDVSTGWEKSSSLVGRGVTRTMSSCLFGVELPDTSSDVSKATHDRCSLTSMVMLTSPSTFGGGGLTGLVIKIEESEGVELWVWPPLQWIVGCPLGLPLSRLMPLASDSGGEALTGTSHPLSPTR